MATTHKEWANQVLRRIDPAFRHRWVVYSDAVKNHLNPETIWIDCGCGDNEAVRAFGVQANCAAGLDIQEPLTGGGNFVKGDIKRLPFASGCADLITLRFVVEHFPEVEAYFSEIDRVLRKNGKVIILTTNILSPLIFLPRLVLPYPIKNWILSRLFKVDSAEIFPTFHKLNSPGKFAKGIKNLHLQHLEFISDLNYTRKWVFRILLFWHILTRPAFLHKFRTNILAVLEKR